MARGDIAWIDLPMFPSSHVQGGRRPGVFVISDAAPRGNPMVMVVPLSTTLPAARFPFSVQIQPTPENGLTSPSIAMVFQLCAVDRTRIEKTIGHLEANHLQTIDDMIRKMLNV